MHDESAQLDVRHSEPRQEHEVERQQPEQEQQEEAHIPRTQQQQSTLVNQQTQQQELVHVNTQQQQQPKQKRVKEGENKQFQPENDEPTAKKQRTNDQGPLSTPVNPDVLTQT